MPQDFLCALFSVCIFFCIGLYSYIITEIHKYFYSFVQYMFYRFIIFFPSLLLRKILFNFTQTIWPFNFLLFFFADSIWIYNKRNKRIKDLPIHNINRIERKCLYSKVRTNMSEISFTTKAGYLVLVLMCLEMIVKRLSLASL